MLSYCSGKNRQTSKSCSLCQRFGRCKTGNGRSEEYFGSGNDCQKTGLPVTASLATERDIYGVIRIYRRDLQKTLDRLIKESFLISGNEDSAPVGKIVDLIIDYAYQDKASDVHIEPEDKESLIRFRIDGILHDFAIVPKISMNR